MFANTTEALIHQLEKQGSTDSLDIQIVEITKLAEKRNWLNKFLTAYTGGKKNIVGNEGLNISRCFVAIHNGKEVGYIRLANYSYTFAKHGAKGEVWGITEGYIKPAYRSKGALRKLIKYAVENCSAKLFRIQTYRLMENFAYYFSLGFTYSYRIIESDMSVVSLGEFRHVLENYCEAQFA